MSFIYILLFSAEIFFSCDVWFSTTKLIAKLGAPVKWDADGQKNDVKGRIVAISFQEKESPQSDTPTILRESMKFGFAVATNEDSVLMWVDI